MTSIKDALLLIRDAPVDPQVINTRLLAMQIETVQRDGIIYPLLSVDADCQLQITNGGSTLAASFVVLDKAIDDDTANIMGTVAQCEAIARRIVGYLAINDLMAADAQATITPIVGGYADRVAGVSVTLSLSYPVTLHNCDD
jgi:hypothetical protein